MNNYAATQTWLFDCCSSSFRRMFPNGRNIDFSILILIKICMARRIFPSPTSITLPSQQSKMSLPKGISLRVPEAERHCIARRTVAATPSWSGSWLPVPTSTLLTMRAVASALVITKSKLTITCMQIRIHSPGDAHHFQRITAYTCIYYMTWARDMLDFWSSESEELFLVRTSNSIATASTKKQVRFPMETLRGASHCVRTVRAPALSEAKRHCIVRRRKVAMPSWSGCWLPVPPST